ncbi:twin-arginine translocation signal domain-containing protein [Halosolutus amylolyticus]|uniref:Twin-arginine translocation signal domain-containing protein n=1 Tax=Halosolutus amylolyticus TaxID=2932267 RepID=A0ABD5PMJ3_9EURY|nr:twin-arginine translocation signal domain-containing protein [Halosolutus amylolyticus]
MNRRGFLRGTAVAGGVATAGCLERLGFEEQSAWANPPIVEDRPDAVYLPAGSEMMDTYGRAADGDVALEVTYTIPHRFWIPGEGGSLVDVDPDDSLHLMLTVWDRETDTVLPVNVQYEILRDGDPIDGVGNSPWPMLAQRMGFHYGDNVPLPDEGSYTVRARVGPVDAVRTGAFEGRLDTTATLTVDFEYAESDVHDIEVELIDEERRGTRDALPLMEHGHHESGSETDHDDHSSDHDVGPAPTSRGPSIDDLPGDVLGTERSGDAKISAVVTDDDRYSDGSTSLAVCPRTPYNDVILPFTSLSVAIEREGTVVHEGTLSETLDDEFGHHYGTGLDRLESGDEITVSIDTPPQVSRHDGYETAFFDFEDVTYSV